MINAATPTLAAGRDRKLPIWESGLRRGMAMAMEKINQTKKSRVLVQGFLLEGVREDQPLGNGGRGKRGTGPNSVAQIVDVRIILLQRGRWRWRCPR